MGFVEGYVKVCQSVRLLRATIHRIRMSSDRKGTALQLQMVVQSSSEIMVMAIGSRDERVSCTLLDMERKSN